VYGTLSQFSTKEDGTKEKIDYKSDEEYFGIMYPSNKVDANFRSTNFSGEMLGTDVLEKRREELEVLVRDNGDCDTEMAKYIADTIFDKHFGFVHFIMEKLEAEELDFSDWVAVTIQQDESNEDTIRIIGIDTEHHLRSYVLTVTINTAGTETEEKEADSASEVCVEEDSETLKKHMKQAAINKAYDEEDAEFIASWFMSFINAQCSTTYLKDAMDLYDHKTTRINDISYDDAAMIGDLAGWFMSEANCIDFQAYYLAINFVIRFPEYVDTICKALNKGSIDLSNCRQVSIELANGHQGIMLNYIRSNARSGYYFIKKDHDDISRSVDFANGVDPVDKNDTTTTDDHRTEMHTRGFSKEYTEYINDKANNEMPFNEYSLQKAFEKYTGCTKEVAERLAKIVIYDYSEFECSVRIYLKGGSIDLSGPDSKIGAYYDEASDLFIINYKCPNGIRITYSFSKYPGKSAVFEYGRSNLTTLFEKKAGCTPMQAMYLANAIERKYSEFERSVTEALYNGKINLSNCNYIGIKYSKKIDTLIINYANTSLNPKSGNYYITKDPNNCVSYENQSVSLPEKQDWLNYKQSVVDDAQNAYAEALEDEKVIITPAELSIAFINQAKCPSDMAHYFAHEIMANYPQYTESVIAQLFGGKICLELCVGGSVRYDSEKDALAIDYSRFIPYSDNTKDTYYIKLQPTEHQPTEESNAEEEVSDQESNPENSDIVDLFVSYTGCTVEQARDITTQLVKNPMILENAKNRVIKGFVHLRDYSGIRVVQYSNDVVMLQCFREFNGEEIYDITFEFTSSDYPNDFHKKF
jgi:hypothetical protein